MAVAPKPAGTPKHQPYKKPIEETRRYKAEQKKAADAARLAAGEDLEEEDEKAKNQQSYRITDEGAIFREVCAVLIWILMFIAFCAFPRFVLKLPLSWSIWVGAAFWQAAVAHTAQMFLVSVPEVTGLITVNWFWRPTVQEPYRGMTVYPTGVWFKFPWEQVKLGNYINMRIVEIRIDENFPAADGPEVHQKGTLVYRPLLDLLPRYIAVDDEVIDNGLKTAAEGRLSSYIGEDDAIQARNSIQEYEKWIVEDMEEVGSIELTGSREYDASGTTGKATIEWLWGIDLLITRLGDSTYEDRFQDGLSRERVSHLIQSVAQGMIAEGMDPKQAWNTAMIQWGLTKKEIIELEGIAFDKLAETVANILNRAGAIAR